MKLTFIHCGTGCTCCNDQNHVRGPYASRADAERRVAYFHAPDSKFWPLASQYARRGNYHIFEKEAEEIGGSRIIVDDEVHYFGGCITVHPDGTVDDTGGEHFSDNMTTW